MNIDVLYTIPTLLLFLLFLLAFTSVSVGGLYLFRKKVHRWLGNELARNEQISYYLSMIGLFYGITLGMIAVGAWENFEEAEIRVSQEAAALTSLVRDMRYFPEPARSDLLHSAESYIRFTVDTVWSLQQQGINDIQGTHIIDRMQGFLYKFEPSLRKEEILLQETLRQFNDFVSKRRYRIFSVETQLPGILWVVILIGALFSIGLTWLMEFSNFSMHMLLNTLMGFFIGSMIFVVFIFDRPFRGDFSISSGDFEQVYTSHLKNIHPGQE